MFSNLNPEDLKFILYLCGGLITIISTGLAVQWRYYKNKLEVKDEKHEANIASLSAQYQKECIEIRSKAQEENVRIRKAVERELSEKQQEEVYQDVPIRQEVKMVYVKYLHIIPSGKPPIYRKYIERLEEEIDVQSEYLYYRFNKYNQVNNKILIKDASSGIVDLNILHPWQNVVFSDKPSRKVGGTITQRLKDSEVYFSATTYYNGFKEDNEDIGMRMEMDTDTARLLADFSSIVGFEKLFINPPDAYKINLEGKKVKIFGLQQFAKGVYYLEQHNLKQGESLLLDFHVDWTHLNS